MCRFSMELEAQSESESFIAQLCEDLKQALIGLRPVEIELSAESHTIKMQEAVAIGLIINELLTNALKYAFPNNRKGIVQNSFARHRNEYRLAICDNGIGVRRHPPGAAEITQQHRLTNG